MLYYYKVYEKIGSTDRKGMFQKISTKLQEVFLYYRKPEAIAKKMAQLKELYKAAIDNAGPKKTGTGPMRCEFFEVHVFSIVIHSKQWLLQDCNYITFCRN